MIIFAFRGEKMLSGEFVEGGTKVSGIISCFLLVFQKLKHIPLLVDLCVCLVSWFWKEPLVSI